MHAGAPPAMDHAQHNVEVAEVWAAYRAGRPIRVPLTLGVNVRYTMGRADANRTGITWRQYFGSAEAQALRQCEHAHWVRHWLNHDHEMGLPEAWGVGVDLQNCFEAAQLGCPLVYRGEQVPDTEPLLADDEQKNLLFDRGLPDPFGGPLAGHAWELFEQLKAMVASGWEFAGRPLGSVWMCGLGTDGPVTVACNMRGATAFLTDLLADPGYAEQLLTFITDATIERLRTYRRALGQPERGAGWSFADDSCALLSAAQYRAHVLPHHRRLVEAFSEPGARNGVHLCGDASHLFLTLRDELNVRSFDTGYPIDLAAVRAKLGPDVELLGGPSVPFLTSHGPTEVEAECRRILTSGVTEGGRFILREGNNLPAECPPENVWAMARAVRQWGRY